MAKRSKEASAIRVALQFAWRRVIGGRDRPRVSDAYLGLQSYLSVAGSEREVAKAAFAAGLLSKRRVAAFIPLDAMDGLVGRTRSSIAPVVSEQMIRDFYESREWRQLAYKCKLRDGRRCSCCGAEPMHGVRIVSDHVIPIRFRWDMRLDPSNIQSLCDDCNLGKGSWDQTRH